METSQEQFSSLNSVLGYRHAKSFGFREPWARPILEAQLEVKWESDTVLPFPDCCCTAVVTFVAVCPVPSTPRRPGKQVLKQQESDLFF